MKDEGWQRNQNEFADEEMFEIFDAFDTPLKNAGMKGSASDIIYQWHELLEYAEDTIGVSGKSYMVTWRLIFASPRSENWRDILTLRELLFTIPISNATLERMFSKLTRVLTTLRSSSKEIRLENILRVMEEGPAWEEYDPIDAINTWYGDADRRLAEESGPRTYTQRAMILPA